MKKWKFKNNVSKKLFKIVWKCTWLNAFIQIVPGLFSDIWSTMGIMQSSLILLNLFYLLVTIYNLTQ